jgi:TonB family protein
MLGSFSTAHGSLSSTNMSARSGDEVRLAGFPSARTPPLQISNRWSVSSSGPTFEKVKIIDMPKPEYTELARSLGIRGVVRVAVVFKADGSVLLTGITHSLGFGLDESAAAAVMHITFQPARRDGKENVDQPAVVEAVFQLSNRALKADEIK